MAVLLLFALIAGAGTAITPCVLPVLPALLSTSAAGGRRRPFGIVLGLFVTFTITVVALSSLIKGVGLAGNTVRLFAIAVLAGFGVMLLVPALGERLEARLSRLARFGPGDRGDGFLSGIGVGAALGFVYAPCAGPILAAVVAGGATANTSAGLVAVAIAYSLGSALVLLVYAFGGHWVGERIRRAGKGLALQRGIGVVMIATALVMATQLDVRFQTALANHFPDALVNPTKSIEESSTAKRELADLRGKSRFSADSANPHGAKQSGAPSDLPVLGTAPDFTGNQRWFNTPHSRPLSLDELRGRVVLVDFWTYTCINCIRTLPYLKAWDRRYRDKGLTIVGVHTPEFEFEKDAGNVGRAIDQNGLRYAVAQDNDFATWNAWGNQYWPAKYLIDAKGNVRYTHFGEGKYGETDAAIRSLLEEARAQKLGKGVRTQVVRPSDGIRTPETYLGSDRAQGFVPRPPIPGTNTYRPKQGKLEPSTFTLGGRWDVSPENAEAVRNSTVRVRFVARRVFLVLSPPAGKTGSVEVELDGKPIPAALSGNDVRGGRVSVRRQRLYELVSLPKVEDRTLTLRLSPGTAGFAFTFG